MAIIRKTLRGGFSLVEVALALGVVAFCLLAIFGLLPTGLNSNRAALEQTAAAGIARAIASDLRAMNPSDTTSAIFKVLTSGTDPKVIFLTEDGVPTTTQTQANPAENPRYRATLYFKTSSSVPTLGKATFLRLWITWPALADKNPAATPKNYSGSYETITLLDRN